MTNNVLPTAYQSIIHLSRYSRYLPEKKRRETWEETVDRCVNYLAEQIKKSNASEEEKQKMLEILG